MTPREIATTQLRGGVSGRFSPTPPPPAKTPATVENETAASSPLPSRHSNDYPFPAPPAFVSDRATRKIDKMFEERNCSRIIILDRELHVLSDHVQSTTPRPYKDATLIKLAHTQAEVETSVFRDLEQEINLHVKGGVAIVTSDGWRLLVLLQHALELGLREKTLGQEVVHKMGERLQWDASTLGCNKPSPTDTRHQESAGKLRRDQGVDHLCFWEPLGHADAGKLGISRDTMRTAGSLSASATLGFGLAPFFEMAAKLAWVADRDWYRETTDQYKLKLKGTLYDRLFNTGGFYCWQGLALVHNMRPFAHIDATDHRDGLAAMQPLGDYVGGRLRLRQFGLRLDYRPTSVCLLRSALISHEVETFTGIRHTAVLFWRDWFRQLAANAVDWDAVRYGFPARYGATRPPPPEDEETTTKAEVKEEVFAEGEAKEESKPDMRTRAAKRTGGGAYSLGMIAAQKRARGGG